MDFNLEFLLEMKDWIDGMTVGVTVKIVIAAGSKVLTPDIRSTKLLD